MTLNLKNGKTSTSMHHVDLMPGFGSLYDEMKLYYSSKSWIQFPEYFSSPSLWYDKNNI